MAFRGYRILTGVFLACLLTACTHYSASNRVENGLQLATQHGWIRQEIPEETFRLAAFTPQEHSRVRTAYVYIEGDGLAWLDGGTPSFNPTPSDPVALKLALKQGEGAAYIARPCQFVAMMGACNEDKWWTSHRFAPEVIAATSRAVDAVKRTYNAETVVLVGYSGGGAVAALVAATRKDVAELITVAGNLDTEAWTTLHGVKRLSGSLNPADQWAALQDIPQRHFVGTADTIMPLAVAQAYADRFPAAKRPTIVMVDGYTHFCCWEEHWQERISNAGSAASIISAFQQ